MRFLSLTLCRCHHAVKVRAQNKEIYRMATRVGTFEVCVAAHVALRMLSAITPAR